MSKCSVCGRRLTNPLSIAKGIGPICQSRNYRGRIFARHGNQYGWQDLESWQEFNQPCFSCQHFVFPSKQQEKISKNGFVVTMNEQTKTFSKQSIGGYCEVLKNLVDGNLIKVDSSCNGKFFEARHEGKKIGFLETPLGTQLVLWN